MWKSTASERLTHWKNFRESLAQLTTESAVQSVAEFWSDCPFRPYYLDIEQVSSWPNPWQLLTDNYYCDVAKALGIVYTLYFGGHGDDVEIKVCRDLEKLHTYNLVFLCQGKYVLNFQDGVVVNTEQINKNLAHIKTYSSTDLKLQEY
jgi:hypothetical protein